MITVQKLFQTIILIAISFGSLNASVAAYVDDLVAPKKNLNNLFLENDLLLFKQQLMKNLKKLKHLQNIGDVMMEHHIFMKL